MPLSTIQKIFILTTIFSVSSLTFLVLLHNAKADEWENITGASLASIVSLDVFRELCDRSIIMPSRFNSFITVCEKKILLVAILCLDHFIVAILLDFGYLNYVIEDAYEKKFDDPIKY